MALRAIRSYRRPGKTGGFHMRRGLGLLSAFELCVAAAVAVSTAAVLLGLLLSGRDRTRVAAWLTALGMTSRQARRLAVLDALPLVLIAVVGAVLAGSVLAQV